LQGALDYADASSNMSGEKTTRDLMEEFLLLNAASAHEFAQVAASLYGSRVIRMDSRELTPAQLKHSRHEIMLLIDTILSAAEDVVAKSLLRGSTHIERADDANGGNDDAVNSSGPRAADDNDKDNPA
jgi:hypothetical protein